MLANLRNLAIAEHRAATDGLTGLPNARSVRETLLRMVAQAGRTATPLSAIAIDLDHFKALNDRYGHQAGRRGARRRRRRAPRRLRASDFAGRWGGEEFVVLLPDTDVAGAAEVAEKLREPDRGASPCPAVPAGVTASLGVASLPEHARDRRRAAARRRPRALRREGGRPRTASSSPGADAARATADPD